MNKDNFLAQMKELNANVSSGTALEMGNVSPTFEDVNVDDDLIVGDDITTTNSGGTLRTNGSIASIDPDFPNGYATGAGGAVTQITNASTAVTLNKVCGQITTVALTTAAGDEERFTVNCAPMIAGTCIPILATTYDGAGTPMLSVVKCVTGAFDIVITNAHAANALNAVMVINFAIQRAVAA